MSHSFHSYVRLLEGKLPLNTIKSPSIIIKSSNHLAIPVQPMPGLEEERKDSEDSECCTPDAGRKNSKPWRLHVGPEDWTMGS